MTDQQYGSSTFGPGDTRDAPDTRAGTVPSGSLGSVYAKEASGGFHLIALPQDGAAGRWRDLGAFPDLDSALLARVEDVLNQLARNDGWLITCEHLVLAPQGVAGPRVAGHVTQLGADPSSDKVPPPHDERELRSWLLTASGLTRTRSAR